MKSNLFLLNGDVAPEAEANFSPEVETSEKVKVCSS